ncbi:MAG: GNAT family N-acetyltransferase [Gammaproteobacteria bacterium]
MPERSDITVAEVPWASYAATLQRVREIVFIDEQQVPREEEWDGQDDSARHFLATEPNGLACGCARLLPTGQIGRMAVLADMRGHGIGMCLLQAALRAAHAAGMTRVFLHAQTHALEFYRKAGFMAHGDAFMEAGIPHREMVRDLADPP